jgi:hypothetical protein
MLFLNCGIRRSELVGLNLSDVYDDRIRVVGKGNKERIVYFGSACRKAIDAYLVERHKKVLSDNRALFGSRDNNRISVKQDTGLLIVSRNSKINFKSNQVLMNAQVTIDAPKGFSEEYDYALAVSGGIMTTKVLVKDVEDWYDIVFEDDYKLLPINKVKRYIDENGHLPDIPSGQDVLMNGYNMVEMDGLLLKKIEELTLYAIELNKLIECQQKIIETLQSK